jgi:hypothetical protein
MFGYAMGKKWIEKKRYPWCLLARLIPKFLLFYDVRQMFVEPSAWLFCDVVTSLRSLQTSSYVMESID